MKTIDGKEGYLAHQDIKSDFYIRRYGVSVENIERIAVPSIFPVENNIIILDEIGKMECFSLAFKQATTNAIDASNIVIGTITLGGDDFIREIKEREDMEISEVTVNNRNLLPDIILRKISNILNTV